MKYIKTIFLAYVLYKQPLRDSRPCCYRKLNLHWCSSSLWESKRLSFRAKWTWKCFQFIRSFSDLFWLLLRVQESKSGSFPWLIDVDPLNASFFGNLLMEADLLFTLCLQWLYYFGNNFLKIYLKAEHGNIIDKLYGFKYHILWNSQTTNLLQQTAVTMRATETMMPRRIQIIMPRLSSFGVFTKTWHDNEDFPAAVKLQTVTLYSWSGTRFFKTIFVSVVSWTSSGNKSSSILTKWQWCITFGYTEYIDSTNSKTSRNFKRVHDISAHKIGKLKSKLSSYRRKNSKLRWCRSNT